MYYSHIQSNVILIEDISVFARKLLNYVVNEFGFSALFNSPSTGHTLIVHNPDRIRRFSLLLQPQTEKNISLKRSIHYSSMVLNVIFSHFKPSLR